MKFYEARNACGFTTSPTPGRSLVPRARNRRDFDMKTNGSLGEDVVRKGDELKSGHRASLALLTRGVALLQLP